MSLLAFRGEVMRRAKEHIVTNKLVDDDGRLVSNAIDMVHFFSDPFVGLVMFRVKRLKKRKEAPEGKSGDVEEDAVGSALDEPYVIYDLEVLVDWFIVFVGRAEQLSPVGRPTTAAGGAADGDVLHVFLLRPAGAAASHVKPTVCIFSAADAQNNASAARMLRANAAGSSINVKHGFPRAGIQSALLEASSRRRSSRTARRSRGTSSPARSACTASRPTPASSAARSSSSTPRCSRSPTGGSSRRRRRA